MKIPAALILVLALASLIIGALSGNQLLWWLGVIVTALIIIILILVILLLGVAVGFLKCAERFFKGLFRRR